MLRPLIGGGRLTPGVGAAEAVEEAGFGLFHAAGLAGQRVVVALQMEHAVDDEVGEVVGEAAAGGACFAADCAEGEDDFAGEAWAGGVEGQDVGGFVAVTVGGVEAFYRGVAVQDDCGAAAGGDGGAVGDGVRASEGAAPGWVGDDYGYVGRLVEPRDCGAGSTGGVHYFPGAPSVAGRGVRRRAVSPSASVRCS